MNDESLVEYRAFIDGLVVLRPSVESKRMQEAMYYPIHPTSADSEGGPGPFRAQIQFNQLLDTLTIDQRAFIAQLLQSARDSGIHDVLVYLTDNHYDIIHNDIKLAREPYGTENYYDFTCRVEGDSWPDQR
jgi:hypothetical protein